MSRSRILFAILTCLPPYGLVAGPRTESVFNLNAPARRRPIPPPARTFLQLVLWSTCHRDPLIKNPYDRGGEDETVDAIEDAPVAWEQASGVFHRGAALVGRLDQIAHLAGDARESRDHHQGDFVHVHPARKKDRYKQRAQDVAYRALPRFLGAERRSHWNAAKSAAHKIREHVARPNKTEREKHELPSGVFDLVQANQVTKGESNEQKSCGADGDGRQHFVQRAAREKSDRNTAENKDE